LVSVAGTPVRTSVPARAAIAFWITFDMSGLLTLIVIGGGVLTGEITAGLRIATERVTRF
jgi:hypothetical protein